MSDVMKERLEQILKDATARIQESDALDKLNDVRVSFLGKKGELTTVLKSMKDVARFVSEKLSTLESVTSTATYFVMKKYKEYGIAMTGGKVEEERMLITP